MKNLILLCLFLCVSIGASAYNKNDFDVRYTVEHTNIAGERWRPIFHIVWPDDFNGDRYKVIIYINYNVQTSDGQWHGKCQIPKLFVYSQCNEPRRSYVKIFHFPTKVAKRLTKSKNTKRYIAKS